MSDRQTATRLAFAAYNVEHPHTVWMRIFDTQTLFYFDDTGQTVVTLPVGVSGIRDDYFKHTPPNYDDIEYAINFIEDEIEKVVHTVPHTGFHLVTDTPFIRQLAPLCFVKDAAEMVLERTALERLFGQYAEIVTGRPPREYEPDISRQFYAGLLIFREYMHHLKFERVTIIE